MSALNDRLERFLLPYAAVRSDWNTDPDAGGEVIGNVFAWGDRSFTVFAEIPTQAVGDPHALVEAIWFSFRSDAGRKNAFWVPRALPRNGDLLLVDWACKCVADLAEAEQIRAYLSVRARD